MKKINKTHRRYGVSIVSREINKSADSIGRAVHYTMLRDDSNRLTVGQAVVMTLEDTYGLRRDHKEHAKAKARRAIEAGFRSN